MHIFNFVKREPVVRNGFVYHTHRAHSKQEISAPKDSYACPKKTNFSNEKIFHPSLKGPITQKRNSDPKKISLIPLKNNFSNDFFRSRLKKPIIWPTHLTQTKKEISTRTISNTYPFAPLY